jgi:hypothetical protein
MLCVILTFPQLQTEAGSPLGYFLGLNLVAFPDPARDSRTFSGCALEGSPFHSNL